MMILTDAPMVASRHRCTIDDVDDNGSNENNNCSNNDSRGDCAVF
jgi:hypothetical protein